MSVRLPSLVVVVVLVMGLSACGSAERPSKAAPGSPQNPLAAKPSKAGEPGTKPTEPGYAKLLEGQSKQPAQHAPNNPCALVTKAQAQAILGGKLLDPVALPQGPTCVYRSRSKHAFATISVQAQSFSALRRQLRRAEQVDVSDRTAYCGMRGRPMLYLPLSGGRVLSVAAQCDLAARLARRAAPRLLR